VEKGKKGVAQHASLLGFFGSDLKTGRKRQKCMEKGPRESISFRLSHYGSAYVLSAR
jgi:hypothetical protein